MVTISSSKHAFRDVVCSLRFRVLATCTVTFAVVLILVNTTPVLTTQRLIMSSKSEEMLKTANMVSASLSGLQTMDSDKVASVMSILDVSGDVRMMVTDSSGLVVYDNAASSSVVGKSLVLLEVRQALSGEDAFRCTYRSGAFESVAAVPVLYKSEVLGAVCFFDVDTDTADLLVGIQMYLRNITLIVIAVGSFLMAFFSLLFQKRISRLSDAIGTMRAGKYDQRIEIGGHDEITQLAEEFNDLSSRLDKTENSRRQFVSDASHELKTPLASIKLLADSIIQNPDMKQEDMRDFLGDISSEIERLTRITDHLLQLTRLDRQAGSMPCEYIDLSVTARRAVRLLKPLADSRGIALHIDAAPECIIEAGEDPIYQVLFNLVENAIKYNVDNGEVHVLTYIKDGKVYCIVDDTGIGIPENELQRIFERFYRVDKARSRETGGTGLGLSIVRQTVVQYGGEVWAENREPHGSRFTVTLPYRGKEAGVLP